MEFFSQSIFSNRSSSLFHRKSFSMYYVQNMARENLLKKWKQTFMSTSTFVEILIKILLTHFEFCIESSMNSERGFREEVWPVFFSFLGWKLRPQSIQNNPTIYNSFFVHTSAKFSQHKSLVKIYKSVLKFSFCLLACKLKSASKFLHRLKLNISSKQQWNYVFR